MLLGNTVAHACLKLDEIPKALFPITYSNGTMSPMRGPAMYHASGLFNMSNIIFYLSEFMNCCKLVTTYYNKTLLVSYY